MFQDSVSIFEDYLYVVFLIIPFSVFYWKFGVTHYVRKFSTFINLCRV